MIRAQCSRLFDLQSIYKYGSAPSSDMMSIKIFKCKYNGRVNAKL